MAARAVLPEIEEQRAVRALGVAVGGVGPVRGVPEAVAAADEGAHVGGVGAQRGLGGAGFRVPAAGRRRA